MVVLMLLLFPWKATCSKYLRHSQLETWSQSDEALVDTCEVGAQVQRSRDSRYQIRT